MQTVLVVLVSTSFPLLKISPVGCVTFGYKEARIGQFPCTAGMLRMDNDELIAGATIVHPFYLLSAVINYEYSGYRLRAIAGDIDHYRNSTAASRQERVVSHYFLFDSLIIFRLAFPFIVTRQVVVYPVHYTKAQIGTKVQIAGWGRPLYKDMKSEKEFTRFMYYIDVELVSHNDCPFDLTGQPGLWRQFLCFRGLPENRLSATCIFDNGSPAYIGKRILGIVSPIKKEWNFVDGRRIEKLNKYQNDISQTVAWNGRSPNMHAIPVLED